MLAKRANSVSCPGSAVGCTDATRDEVATGAGASPAVAAAGGGVGVVVGVAAGGVPAVSTTGAEAAWFIIFSVCGTS
ncbi:MAG: hypothetical protein E6F98_16270 [Actinobacteria bacterium]|nr:MAG: hypothetical protein E6F98_16270 [Actinomycetota bacterium]